MSSSNCCFLTRIQISQEAGEVVWYSRLLKDFPVCCDPYSQRLWRSPWSRSRCFSGTLLFFSVIHRMLGIWSLVPLPFLNPAWTSGRLWFLYCWSLAWRTLSIYFASVWDECNCVVFWTFYGITFLWDWNENWPFPVLWPLIFADILGAALSQHHLLGFGITKLEFHHLH